MTNYDEPDFLSCRALLPYVLIGLPSSICGIILSIALARSAPQENTELLFLNNTDSCTVETIPSKGNNIPILEYY